MELLFVTVIAAAIGLLARYTIPGRSAYGLLLAPAVGAVAAAVVWVALVWLGFTFDGGWIWTISLAAAVAACLATTIVLPRARATADANLRRELGI